MVLEKPGFSLRLLPVTALSPASGPSFVPWALLYCKVRIRLCPGTSLGSAELKRLDVGRAQARMDAEKESPPLGVFFSRAMLQWCALCSGNSVKHMMSPHLKPHDATLASSHPCAMPGL